MDLFEKLEKRFSPLGQYAEMADGYYMYPKLEGNIGRKMFFNGKEKLVWSLNNYLGLANHPEVRKSDAEAAQRFGMGMPMGARMMSGNSDYHEELENQLSQLVGKEDTFYVNYGYQGMVSAIDALVDRHDIVIYDAESHACIIDGLRLHIGKRFVYKHNDIDDLKLQLERAQKILDHNSGSVLVITEGVFGMSGKQGKLKEIIELKKYFNFRLFVDDAHGFGTMGKTGAGTGEFQGVQDGIDIYFGTFAKAIASIGAFISSTKSIVRTLKYNMRSQIFAKSLPLPLVTGAIARLKVMKEHPELRDKLWLIANSLQNGLKELNFDTGGTNSPVTPVFLKGEVEEALKAVYDLRENYDIFCSIVVYPVVPKGVIMLRLIPTADHTLDDVKYTLNAFSEIRNKLEDKTYQIEET